MWENKLNASQAINLPMNDNDILINNQYNNNNNNSSSVASSSSTDLRLPVTSQSNYSTEQVDIKPSIDSATRAAIQALPHGFYNQNNKKQNQMSSSNQLDGIGKMEGGSSSEDDDDDDEIVVGGGDDDDDLPDDNVTSDDHGDYIGKEDPDPLNSDDDLTGPDSNSSNSELFDTEQVIVCQYDKVFYL
jgi:hypothetical protein